MTKPVLIDPILIPEEKPLKLDLACGQNPREGFEGVDLFAPGAQHRVNLFHFPFPWKDNSVDEISCSHFVEHLPAREVVASDVTQFIPKGSPGDGTHFIGQDFFFAFFDEVWRILKPGGIATITCPCARSNRAFQDPTHRRFIVSETFAYLAADWRKAMSLDHYNVKCDFEVQVNPGMAVAMAQELNLRTDEVKTEWFNMRWNVIMDWQALLKKKVTP